MYFLIKEENVFDKYAETWEKRQQYHLKKSLTVNLHTI